MPLRWQEVSLAWLVPSRKDTRTVFPMFMVLIQEAPTIYNSCSQNFPLHPHLFVLWENDAPICAVTAHRNRTHV